MVNCCELLYMPSFLHPKKIPLSEIDEVVIYHSWFEPTRKGVRGRRWTVRVRHSNNKHTRFMICDKEIPNYERLWGKTFWGIQCGLGQSGGATSY